MGDADPSLQNDRDAPILWQRRRAHVFVDYWNFALAQRQVALQRRGVTWRIDWQRFPAWLVERAEDELAFDYLTHVGTIVFTSFNPSNPNSVQHRNWANGWLGRQPATEVVIYEQQRVPAPTCPACNIEMSTCSECGAGLAGFQEKSVDTALAISIVEKALRREIEVAILVTSDSDLIPAVDAAHRRGCLVVQAAFPPGGRRLRRRCDAVIDIDAGRSEISR